MVLAFVPLTDSQTRLLIAEIVLMAQSRIFKGLSSNNDNWFLYPAIKCSFYIYCDSGLVYDTILIFSFPVM